MVEIVSLKEVRKVKGIQMFKSPVQTAAQGDRIGLCVTQFDAKLLERGLVCKQGIVPLLHAGIINLEKVPYFKGDIATNSKFHISLGHETVLGKITLFQGRPDSKEFSMEQDFKYVDSLAELSKDEESEKDNGGPVYALIEFEHPINVVPGCKGIQSSSPSKEPNINSRSVILFPHFIFSSWLET